MSVLIRRLALGLALLAAAACADGGGEPPADLVQASDAYADAVRRTDAAAVVSLFSEDAVILQPGFAPILGRDALAGFLGTIYQMLDVRTYEIQERELWAAGDRGHEFTLVFQRIGFGEIAAAMEARMAFEWVREEDGAWRIRRAVYNQMDLEGPPGGPGEEPPAGPGGARPPNGPAGGSPGGSGAGPGSPGGSGAGPP